MSSKKEIRRLVLERRRQWVTYADPSAGMDLMRHVVSVLLSMWLVEGGDIVCGIFSSFKGEPDILSLGSIFAEEARKLGCDHVSFQLALPCVVAEGESLIFRLYHEGDVLVSGYKGILEPSDEMEEVVPTHLCIPLVAFDRLGGRLGYGGGFYDRTLHAEAGFTPRKIGVAWSCQESESLLPLEAHDIVLDYVVTERGVMDFKKNSSPT